MSELPWQRYGAPPEEPAAEPVAQQTFPGITPPPAPTPPPVNVPAVVVPPIPDLGAILGNAFSEALAQAAPVIRSQAVDYARETVQSTLRGEKIDHTAPSITLEQDDGKKLVIADARNRSWRTLLQGLAIDLLAALGAVLVTIGGMPIDKVAWATVGALLGKSIIQAGASFVMRLKISPTIRTHSKAMPAPVIVEAPR